MAHQSSSSASSVKSNHSIHTIITQGYILKQGNILNKSFKKKYFVLYQGRSLKYFDTDKCLKNNGEMDLSQVSSITYKETKPTAKYQYPFDIITNNKTWTLSLPNNKKQLSDEWITHLKESAFGSILFHGWAYKRGGKVQSWKHRFFILSQNKILRYYEDEQCTKYKGCLSLTDVIKIQAGDPLQEYDHIIYLTTPTRIWCLSTPDKESQTEWIECLNHGQSMVNYDEKASIFVRTHVQCKSKSAIHECLAIERVKFVLCIYMKWLHSQVSQQKRAETIPKMSLSIKRAATLNMSRSKKSKHFKSRSETVDTVGMLKLSDRPSMRKGIYDIINNDLKQYRNKELLNDFGHICDVHCCDDSSFEQLNAYLTAENEEKSMDIPLSVVRTFRDRRMYAIDGNNAQRQNLYFNYDSEIGEIATQTLLDSIYLYLFYSFKLCRLTAHEMDLKIKSKSDENYIDCNEIGTANMKQLLSAKRRVLLQSKNRYKLQLREGKFLSCEMKGNASVNINGLYHCFGSVKFLYWDSCKNDGLYIRGKCAGLKDELLNNTVCNISLPQYETVQRKAMELHSTDRALRTGAFSQWKIGSGADTYAERYNIEEDTPITINHIISCVIYCNYYEFAQIYKSTFANDSLTRDRHKSFAYFSRFLVESVTVFGKPICEYGLYHSIFSDGYVFNYLANLYINPISLSKDFGIVLTQNERLSDGLIVKLGQCENKSAFTMDCAWLSDFVGECEHICAYNTEPMRIDTIIHIETYSDYKTYIHGINSLEHLLRSQMPIYGINDDCKRALNKLISHRFNKNKLKNNQRYAVPTYVSQLFERKCRLLTQIEIDCRQIFEVNNGCYNIFKPLLIDCNNDWIKIDLFAVLFPNLISVTIRCYNYLIFDANTVSELIAVLKLKTVKNKSQFRIEFNEPNQSEMMNSDMSDVIKKYYKTFKKLNYEMLNVNESIIIRKENKTKKRKKLKKSVSNSNNHLSVSAAVSDGNNIDDSKVNEDSDCCIM